MKGINLGRVILGGIVAGILINISEFLLNEKVLKSDWEAAMRAFGKNQRHIFIEAPLLRRFL